MDTQTIIAEVKSVLQYIDFPTHKDEVVAQAKAQGASQEAVQTLDAQLPEQKFNGIEDILSKLPLGNIENEIEKFM